MLPRFHHIGTRLREGDVFALDPTAARHVQVLRLQPGAPIVVFDGRGGEWEAEVVEMGRVEVRVRAIAHCPVEREIAASVTLALGMPANDRMDALVEKATELGVAVIQPLVCQRSVLRLAGERAQRKVEHWQAVAVAACEQCGRNQVPVVHPVQTLSQWLAVEPNRTPVDSPKLVLSFGPASQPLASLAVTSGSVMLLSGPEGGLAPEEEALALSRGFTPTSLGPRVLRADTAPLAALAWIGLQSKR